MKNIYHKPTSNLILKGERQCSSLRLRVRQGGLFSPLLSSTALEVLTTTVRKEEGIKGIPMGKGKVKSSPFADHKIVYVENPKESKKKNLLEPINKVEQSHRMQDKHTQKSITFPFPYTNNKHVEITTKNTTRFTLTPN